MKQTKESNVSDHVILKSADIITRIKAENAIFWAGMNETKVAHLVDLALEEFARNVANIEKGVVKVPGFGSFRVQQLEREKGGETTASRRVVFNMIKPKKGTAHKSGPSDSPDAASDDAFQLLAGTNKERTFLQKSQVPRSSLDEISPDDQVRTMSSAMSEVSEFSVKVGSISDDGTTIVGKNGFLFLVGGSNNVGQMYSLPDAGLSDKWLKLITARYEETCKRHNRFLQIFIPEKSTALNSLFPLDVNVPAPLYKKLQEKIVNNEALKEKILFYDDIVGADISGLSAYLKTGSHLTTLGAEYLFRAQLRLLGESVSYKVVDQKRSMHSTDLGAKYGALKIVEPIDLYSELCIDGINCKPLLVEELIPPTGNIGTTRVYKNTTAPIRKKVVAFANSFFWSGGTSRGQCWWYSRMFKEFHFVWSPSILYDYLDSVRPDIVVCQSIERFMRRVPHD